MSDKKHVCGCVTSLKDGIVNFDFMCAVHVKNKKYVWIALQHPEAVVEEVVS